MRSLWQKSKLRTSPQARQSAFIHDYPVFKTAALAGPMVKEHFTARPRQNLGEKQIKSLLPRTDKPFGATKSMARAK
jgi:hypothetical protein